MKNWDFEANWRFLFTKGGGGKKKHTHTELLETRSSEFVMNMSDLEEEFESFT
jgi:uncharacterized protein Veg